MTRASIESKRFNSKRWIATELGLPSSALIKRRKSGKPDLRCQAGNDAGWIIADGDDMFFLDS